MTRYRIHLVAMLIAAFASAVVWADDPPPPPTPFAEAAAYAQPRCVKIYGAAIGREHGYATGIIVAPDGKILTAEGIYLAGDRIRVVTADGKLHFAGIERRNDDLQLVMLKIEAPTPYYFEVPAESIIEPGDWTIAVSNCFKAADGTEQLSVNLGVMSLLAALDTRRRAIDFDVAGDIMLIDAITSNPGSPGGALMTYDGQLAGMVGKLLESESTGTRLNYAVPCDLLRKFIDGKQVVEPVATNDQHAQPTGEPYVGIRLFRMAGKRAPAYIDRIDADSPAAKAGLKKDDLVLAVGETIVRNVGHYDEVAATLKPGEMATIIVKRKQEVVRVDFSVGTKPEDE